MGKSLALLRVVGRDKMESNSLDYNVGLQFIASYAEFHDIETDIFDPIEEAQIFDIDFSNYMLLGFYVHILNISETLTICKKIKNKFPDIFIILGGHHCVENGNIILEDNSFIDYLCVGEGEEVIVELCKKISRNEKPQRCVFYSNSYVNLNSLQILPKYLSKSRGRLSTSRGCPYFCSFCTTPVVTRNTNRPLYRSQNPKNVVSLLGKLYDAGVKKVYINDDIFFSRNKSSRARVIAIAMGILEGGIKIKYKPQLRVDSFDGMTIAEIDLLKKSGMKAVFLGIESGSQKILDEFGKKLNVSASKRLLHILDEVGIQVNAGNILVSPFSDRYQVVASIDNFYDMGIAYMFFRRVTFKPNIFPGTPLENKLIKKGLVDENFSYQNRNYRILDERLNDLVNLFEGFMPEYIQIIGEKLFKSRTLSLETYYNVRRYPEIKKALWNWNESSRDLIRKWMISDNCIQMNEFDLDCEAYIGQSIAVNNILEKFITKGVDV